ncbi:MAG: 1-deoxy-D-xylulose-5-phosphate synthase [Elusimicrobia bacterium]|nr:1-deoxy-D-xylulose-5-phosphate synthase [Elusimicrobiota bacterium]
MKVLEMINSPKELHLIKDDLLPELVDDIRKAIIETCSKTGGHLAGSLGAVELIVALHYVFDAPDDKIVFDVGHQAYAHKILTGRYKQFSTLRQFGGISGFPKISESEYDTFGVGHASTAISAAFGLVCARDLKNQNHKVIAVVGDGSLTGGLAYEGLNNAGASRKDLLVILNDNKMFISPRVGAIGRILTRLFTLGLVKKAEDSVVRFLARIKTIGAEVLKVARRIKVLLFPGMLFEEMGFSYFGPVNGHNLKNLIFILSRIKNLKGPVCLHVMTKKGKGYLPAEKKPSKFHGVSRFDIETGETPPPARIYSNAFGETMCKLAEQDKDLVAITAAMTDGTGLEEFAEKFPKRFFDCGIAEGHAVTFAAGLARGGMKPVVAIYSTFLQRAYDQIIHDVCLQNLSVVFAVDRAGLVGEDGPTHHGSFDLSYLRIVPNLVVAAPKDEKELGDLIFSALKYKMPTAVRYPRGAVEGVLSDEFNFIPMGKAEVLKEGGDVVIIAIGAEVYPAMLASRRLESRGVKTSLINARFAKPLDIDLINEFSRKAKFVFTVEENTVCGGFGGAVLENIALEVRGKVEIIALPDRFITHGKQDIIRKDAGVDAESIFRKITEKIK